jgi:hypothetical protein
MDLVLAADNTIGFSIRSLCNVINAKADGIKASPSEFRLRFEDMPLNGERDVNYLEREDPSPSEDRIHLYFTNVPFDDNYFYHGSDSHHIVSFFGWSMLTDVALATGALHFIARVILKHRMRVGINHDYSSGCLNDFMWDKSIINAAIRAAFYCGECTQATPRKIREGKPFLDLMALLDFSSAQARLGRDILDVDLLEQEPRPTSAAFDAFLCHNSNDKPAARRLNTILKAAGVRTWFDEEQLQPGQVWQDKLEEQIALVHKCVILVGPQGEGPWQEMERRAFIGEFAQRRCPIIPVILPGCLEVPQLPLFLRQFMWVDLRQDDDIGVAQLANALRQRE